MNVVDILISIVVVTILVTIILAIVTYAAYKLRLSREPARAADDPSALRYFRPYEPPEQEEGRESEGPGASETSDDSALDHLDRDVADLEGHATQT